MKNYVISVRYYCEEQTFVAELNAAGFDKFSAKKEGIALSKVMETLALHVGKDIRLTKPYCFVGYGGTNLIPGSDYHVIALEEHEQYKIIRKCGCKSYHPLCAKEIEVLTEDYLKSVKEGTIAISKGCKIDRKYRIIEEKITYALVFPKDQPNCYLDDDENRIYR